MSSLTQKNHLEFDFFFFFCNLKYEENKYATDLCFSVFAKFQTCKKKKKESSLVNFNGIININKNIQEKLHGNVFLPWKRNLQKCSTLSFALKFEKCQQQKKKIFFLNKNTHTHLPSIYIFVFSQTENKNFFFPPVLKWWIQEKIKLD